MSQWTLYDFLPSGNGYKCRLAMHQLQKPFQLVQKNILEGVTRTPEFLAMNPNGRIPLLDLGDGRYLAESNVATPRFWLHELPEEKIDRAQLAKKQELGRAALGVMEGHLATRAFFVGERYSVSDIALYAYTHVADEAGLDLTSFPAVRRWLGRVKDQPRHVPITHVGPFGS